MSISAASLRDVTEFDKEPPKWVISDFIPVGVTLLAGPPKKSYKSTITIIEACLAARWKCEALPVWMSCDLGGPTIMVPYEANGGEILWVLEDGLKLTPDYGCLSVVHSPWDFQLDKPHAMAELLELLDERQPRLVVIDPFRNCWSGDENDAGQVIAVLGPLVRWSHANEAAVIVVHHINKPPTDAQKQGNAGGMYSMRGSSALPGLADGIVVIEPTNDEGIITIHTTFKRGSSWRRTIQLGVPGYGWPSQGYEVVPTVALNLRDEWRKWQGASVERCDESFVQHLLAETRIQSVGSLRSHMALLDRNLHIELTPDERRFFLGHAPGGGE